MSVEAGPSSLRKGGLQKSRAPLGVRLIKSERFQKFAERFWLTRPFVRREGAAIFDLMSGFVQSQVLLACVRLELFERIGENGASVQELAPQLELDVARTQALCRAAAALSLLRQKTDDTYVLTPRGAAVASLEGLKELIAHHEMFYRDLADPVALLRGKAETQLSHFWPYVRGEGGMQQAAEYSRLMAQTQKLVIKDTLDTVDLGAWGSLVDIGGGVGRFIDSVSLKHPNLRVGLLDLPDVLDVRRSESPAELHPQSFLDPLPKGYRSASLVRVLYDHDDETVARLLSNIYACLPRGGRLLISEPMAGHPSPERATDVYFSFYTMAMNTGRVRSPEQISELLRAAGFAKIESPAPFRPFITRVLTAQKP